MEPRPMSNSEFQVDGLPQPEPAENEPVESDGSNADSTEDKSLEEKVIDVLQKVFDPEIPVNIYDLGLIYNIKIQPDNHVLIDMTLTSPACPVAGSLPGEVRGTVCRIPEVTDCEVELVWEPPWGPNKMSEVAKVKLDMV